MRKKLLLFFIVCVLVLTIIFTVSCSSNAYKSESTNSNLQNKSPAPEKGDGSNSIVLQDRKIVYTVYTSLYTEDKPQKTHEKIVKLLKDGEWVEGEEINNTYGRITVRVKASRLDQFLTDLSTAGEVADYSKQAEDITTQYTNIEERLKSLNKQKEALDNLLLETSNISEITELTIKIAEITTQIEYLQAQKDKSDELIEYSTVIIHINQNYKEVEPLFKDEIKSDFKNSWGALVSFFKFLLRAIIYIFPFALVGGGIATGIFFIVKDVKRKKKLKSAMKESKDKKEDIDQ